MTIDDLDTMLEHYLIAALWSSTGDDDEPLDDDHDISDIADQSVSQARERLADFINENADDLADLDAEQAGHDFWLTRNRHGAGFWDRGLGDVGGRLTDASHNHGSADPYIGDDGKIYIDD